MNEQIINTHCRHAGHEWLPLPATCERYVQTIFSTHKQQVFVLRIFSNYIDVADRRQVVRNVGPGGAVISSHEQVRLEIIRAMTINGEITSARIEVRRF